MSNILDSATKQHSRKGCYIYVSDCHCIVVTAAKQRCRESCLPNPAVWDTAAVNFIKNYESLYGLICGAGFYNGWKPCLGLEILLSCETLECWLAHREAATVLRQMA